MVTIMKKWIDVIDFTFNTDNPKRSLSLTQKALGYVKISQEGIFATEAHKVFVAEDIFPDVNPYDLSRPVYISRPEIKTILKNIPKNDVRFELIEEKGEFYADCSGIKVCIANPEIDYPTYEKALAIIKQPRSRIKLSLDALYLKQIAEQSLKGCNGARGYHGLAPSVLTLNIDPYDVTTPFKVDMGDNKDGYVILCPYNNGFATPAKKRVFKIERCRKDPDNPGGYLTNGRATYKELFMACREMLEEEGLLGQLDYFDPYLQDDLGNHRDESTPLPDDYKWFSCFAVTGDSEGWYVHVEMIRRDGRREPVCLGKLLTGGISKAYQIAGELARFLQA